MPFDWSPWWIALRYAGISTLGAALVALPLAWWLARRPVPGAGWFETAAGLPLILPPAVLLYYLLVALGRWALHFSWHAAVILSAVYNLPILFGLARASLAAHDSRYENAARVLGAGEWRCFWRVTLPLEGRAWLAAFLVAFARAFADFLATALVAQNAAAWLFLPAVVLALAILYGTAGMRRPRVPA